MVRNNCKNQINIKGYRIITLRIYNEGIFEMIKNVFDKLLPVSKDIIPKISKDLKTIAKEVTVNVAKTRINSAGKKIGDEISNKIKNMGNKKIMNDRYIITSKC